MRLLKPSFITASIQTPEVNLIPRKKFKLPLPIRDLRDIRFPGLPDNCLPVIKMYPGKITEGYAEIRKAEVKKAG